MTYNIDYQLKPKAGLRGMLVMSLLVLAVFYPAHAQFSLVPLPVAQSSGKGFFLPDNSTLLYYNHTSLEKLALRTSSEWKQQHNFFPAVEYGVAVTKGGKSIQLHLNPDIRERFGSEGYQIKTVSHAIEISAATIAGISYGLVTLGQMLDASTEEGIAAGTITDYPRFGYRGLHLDVSRHFMPVSFVFRLLDQMEQHKLNMFHWHLIDDQGWRLEIKKHPGLTEIGGFRADYRHIHWNSRPITDTIQPQAYGGFYTQDEIRAVVAYAAERNITVIPEIEMPAHVMSALAAYPHLSCTGENLGVPPGGVWPISHIYCAGKEETFVFLEEVLTEVMELFPSKMIHIGGDEADKSNWKKCPACQKRIADEGLKDEHELQSYFIRRIEQFLHDNGRQLIGWDEILEGGLPERAIVMSWRGEEGGIEAVKMGNKAIMTPGSHCYFDHYQGDPAMEPLAIGGYTTLKKVYHYEPIPEGLSQVESSRILGAQANVWTEYMPDSRQVEYMIFPRIAALAEVLWTPAQNRSWHSFSKRMEAQYQRYQKHDINFSRSAFQVTTQVQPDTIRQQLIITLETESHDANIHYTLDGSMPDENSAPYEKPFSIGQSTELKAAVISNGAPVGPLMRRKFDLHQAFLKKISLQYPNEPRYDGGGSGGLNDGVFGSVHFNDGRWKGFLGNDLVAVIDLGSVQRIHETGIHVLNNPGSWIFFPEMVGFDASFDGVDFFPLGEISPDGLAKSLESELYLPVVFNALQARYIRVRAKNTGKCPPGHPGEGKKAWLFVSEIVVR